MQINTPSRIFMVIEHQRPARISDKYRREVSVHIPYVADLIRPIRVWMPSFAYREFRAL